MSARPTTQVGALLLPPAVRVASDVSLEDAASLMRREDISSLVVDTHPSSFVTERDLVRALADRRRREEPVTAVATRAPVWVPWTLSVVNAAAIMARYELRHLVVLDQRGAPIGVLSIRQALDILVSALDPDGWMTAFSAMAGDV